MQTYDPALYQMTVISKALEVYATHKLRVNRAYTPKAMMATASRLTGRTFKPRDYAGAAKALRAARDKRLEELRAAQIAARTLGTEFGGAL